MFREVCPRSDARPLRAAHRADGCEIFPRSRACDCRSQIAESHWFRPILQFEIYNLQSFLATTTIDQVRTWSIPAGKIAGIDIRIHFTFFLLLVFIIFSDPEGS